MIKQASDIRLGDWLMPDGSGIVVGYVKSPDRVQLTVRWSKDDYSQTWVPANTEFTVFPGSLRSTLPVKTVAH